MAKRRMFSESVVENDFFLDLPLTSQALYFHIGMKADDDGICSSVKVIMRTVGANQNDLDLLFAKGFLIKMPEGIAVIKHWRINNYLQRDGKHYHESEYDDVKGLLYLKKNRAYTLDPEKGVPLVDKKCIQNLSIDKISKDKISIEEISLDKSSIEVEKGYKGKGVTSDELKRKCYELRKRRYGD